MKTSTLIIFSILFFESCRNNSEPTKQTIRQTLNDTIIGKKIIRRSDQKIENAVYFLIHDNDTSNLRYEFSQNLAGEVEIVVYDNNPLLSPTQSYREEAIEQKLILREAANDFDLRSLEKIWDLSLTVTGDLAIQITKQLPPEYLNKSLNNLDVAQFLLASKLTKDLDELLKPYGKKIKRYVVEKAQFLDSSIFFKYNKIETPRSEIPSKILDAQIWTVIENNGI